jgi:hypothetical protein
MNLVDRVQKLLVAPTSEWAAIKAEPQTVASLYTQYVMILAAIPAVAAFIGWSVVGYGGMGATYRIPIAAGVANMVLSYVLTLGGVYAIALVIDALAPNFGGEKDFIQALKVSAFFPTAWWIAGFFYLLPTLSILAIVGGLYSLWLLYTGLAPLMSVHEEKAVGYTASVVLVAIVVTIAIALVGALAMPSTTRGF